MRLLVSDVKSSYGSFGAQSSVFLSIKGKIKQLGMPLLAPVFLFEKHTLQARQTTSNEDGEYQFKGVVKGREYFIVSHHPAREFNAVIQDNVVPK